MSVYNNPSILIDDAACNGCSKCIRVCPVFSANIAFDDAQGQKKTRIDEQKCIHCGQCVKNCPARSYVDDTDAFFDMLSRRDAVSLVVAPSIRTNFPNYKRLFGYLKSKGVRHIYDTSLGADITTWAYLKYIRESKPDSVISQPCPAVVNYIQHFHPELLSKLSPVQSPMMCMAVYAREYIGNKDRLVGLSPCIAKGDEFKDPNTGRILSHNVTFKKMQEHLNQQHVNLSRYPEVDFDLDLHHLGAVYPRPGGLRENVEYYVPGAFVRQIEGEHLYEYLDEYVQRMKEGRKLPLLVDCLNCQFGCNLGSGTNQQLHLDDVDILLNAEKSKVMKEDGRELLEKMDEVLDLKDFLRKYQDLSQSCLLPYVSESEIQGIFRKMDKTDEKKQSVDCSACGFTTCHEMAKAIALGISTPAHCVSFINEIMKNTMTAINPIITTSHDELFGVADSISSVMLNLSAMDGQVQHAKNLIHENKDTVKHIMQIAHESNILSINAQIEAARAGESGKAFSIVAEEMQRLSIKVSQTMQSSAVRDDQMNHAFEEIAIHFDHLHHTMGGIDDSTKMLKGNFENAKNQVDRIIQEFEQDVL